MIHFTIFLTIAAVGLVTMSRSTRTRRFTGSYTLTNLQGTSFLAMKRNVFQRVTGTLVGYKGATYQLKGKISVDEAGRPYAQGRMTGPQGDALFVFRAAESNESSLVITPFDALGHPHFSEAVEFAAERNVAAESATPAARKADIRRLALGDRTLEPLLVG